MEKLCKQAKEILGEDADIMILAQKDDQYMCGMLGEADNVAEAYFATMHKAGAPSSIALHRILKLVVMNVLANPSPFAVDLAESIYDILEEQENDTEDESAE